MTEEQKIQIKRKRAAGNGYGTIARELNLSINTVKSFCRRNQVDREISEKAQPESSNEITRCETCGQEIRQQPKRKKKRFCCDQCRNAWWNHHLDRVARKAVREVACAGCGKTFSVYGRAERKYCSHACYIRRRFGGDGSE